VAKEQSLDNLWLAQALYDLGGVQFGNFTVSESAVSSPVFVNPKVLISNQMALRVARKLMQQAINLPQSLRRPRVHPFGLVAGVPVGGLLLATAYSLETNIPLIYARARPEGTGKRGIEGRYTPGETVLVIDDLITRGSSILETSELLQENGLKVKDVIVLIDREHGAVAGVDTAAAPRPFSVLRVAAREAHRARAQRGRDVGQQRRDGRSRRA